MNAFGLIADAARQMTHMLRSVDGCRRLEPEFSPEQASGLRWDNTLLAAPLFRRAHVETLHIPDRLSVLHVCVFPHFHDPAAIFGFDLIAGPSRVTGIFLDLSPTSTDTRWRPQQPRFENPRQIPDWGDIFSADFLAIRPVGMQEVATAMDLAIETLQGYLGRPGHTTSVDAWPGQMRYMRGQRRNVHTARMLASLAGEATAQAFIDKVLFPLEPCPAHPQHAAA